MKITLLSIIAFASIGASSSASINSYYGPHLRKLQQQDCLQDGTNCDQDGTQQQLQQGEEQQGQGDCLQEGFNCDQEGLQEGDGSQGNLLQRMWRYEKLSFQNMFGKNAGNVTANNNNGNSGNLRRAHRGGGNCTELDGDFDQAGWAPGNCEGQNGDYPKGECDQDGDCDGNGPNSPGDCDKDGDCEGPHGDGPNSDCDQDGDCDGSGPNGDAGN